MQSFTWRGIELLLTVKRGVPMLRTLKDRDLIGEGEVQQRDNASPPYVKLVATRPFPVKNLPLPACIDTTAFLVMLLFTVTKKTNTAATVHNTAKIYRK